MNVTREKERMLGEARKAALSYQCLVGRTTRIVCDDGFEVAIRWRAENFAHLCGLDYYADDHRRRSLPARRLYVDLLARKRISPKRVAPTGDANWLKAKADVIAGAFELDKAELVVESGNSRVRLYFGGSAWHLGPGRDDNGLYYPKSLKKGPNKPPLCPEYRPSELTATWCSHGVPRLLFSIRNRFPDSELHGRTFLPGRQTEKPMLLPCRYCQGVMWVV